MIKTARFGILSNKNIGRYFRHHEVLFGVFSVILFLAATITIVRLVQYTQNYRSGADEPAVNPPVPLNLDLVNWYENIDGDLANGKFGAYITLPVEDKVYFGVSAGKPRRDDGAMPGKYELSGEITPLLDEDSRNAVTEQGLHDFE